MDVKSLIANPNSVMVTPVTTIEKADFDSKAVQTAVFPEPLIVGEEVFVQAVKRTENTMPDGSKRYGFMLVCSRGEDKAEGVEGIVISNSQLTRRGQSGSEDQNVTPATLPIAPTVISKFPEDKFELIPAYDFAKRHGSLADLASAIESNPDCKHMVLAADKTVPAMFRGAAGTSKVMKLCFVKAK